MDEFPSGDGIPGGDWSFDLNVLRGDATGEGEVGYLDLGFVATFYDRPATFDRGDFNGDGVVDYLDLGILAGNYGRCLGPPGPAVSMGP